ncbi:lipase-like, putative [Bodo saltans]|uniref:Lipase-like, putative n=1 Tax=Bodo saltans TaxID=75058 RepID=A0A0S4J8Z3_BODSA|nr:lipase-like, putative [Bodo saltans]|eukprot:CUG72874.1 lipase-like, putative [Bodo saltans]
MVKLRTAATHVSVIIVLLAAIHLLLGNKEQIIVPEDPWCDQWRDPEHRIVISCLGDSITFGDGSHHVGIPVKASRAGRGNFPMAMRGMMMKALLRNARELRCANSPKNEQLVVHNFGVPGATLTPSSLQYEMTEAFRKALTVEATLVIIMLGTNDSREWLNATHFMTHYQRLVRSVRRDNSKLPVMVLSPPPCYPESALFLKTGKCKPVFGINCDVVRRDVSNACRRAVVEGDPFMMFIDVFGSLVNSSSTRRNLDDHFRQNRCPSKLARHTDSIISLFSDGVHPTQVTSNLIADIVSVGVAQYLGFM